MIIPVLIELRDWADAMTQSLEVYGPVPRLENLNAWQDWAAEVNKLPGLTADAPPNPYDYQDWRQWAFRFIALPTLKD